MNDRTPFITAEPTQAEIVNRLSRANSHVLHELADLITVFGAHGELSGADFVENAGGIFAKMLHAAGLPAVTGTTTSLTWWRAVAEGRGIEHDGEYGSAENVGREGRVPKGRDTGVAHEHDRLAVGAHARDDMAMNFEVAR